VFASIVFALALTDVLDGSLARGSGSETRMGRMLDPLADMALATFLALGLLKAGVLPIALFALIMVRYPGALVAVVVLYFARGPIPLRPTAIVRATALASNVVLIVAALALLLEPVWLPTRWIDWSLQALYVVVAVNLVHLIRRAVRWQRVPQEVAG
jgi:phosphatidylglycerophosphate synthase